MLDIGFQELAVIMVLALLIFGPDKLPELGRRLGRALRDFRRASDEFRSTVETNLRINEDLSIPPASGPPTDGTDGQAAPVPEPAAATAEAPAEAPASGEPLDLGEPFWASRGGRLLHRRECAWRARIAAAEQMPLKTAAEGWEQGLKACPVCDPKEVEVPS
jgi:TatA/E family protein of Tat protein translocase